MAFESKGKVRYNKAAKREAKVQTLKAENNPDARKQLKAMNDIIIPKRAGALGEFFRGKKGKAKVRTRGNDDSQRINKNLSAKRGGV